MAAGRHVESGILGVLVLHADNAMFVCDYLVLQPLCQPSVLRLAQYTLSVATCRCLSLSQHTFVM
jgi:hypothetical protein